LASGQRQPTKSKRKKELAGPTGKKYHYRKEQKKATWEPTKKTNVKTRSCKKKTECGLQRRRMKKGETLELGKLGRKPTTPLEERSIVRTGEN